MITDMKQYGLTDRILALAAMYPVLTVGRIVSQEKGLYRIATSKGEKLAEVSGKFRYGAVTVSDYPAVGDFVMADWNDAGGNAVIHYVLHRKSCFTRKAVGDARQEQIVAANIDTVFLCNSFEVYFEEDNFDAFADKLKKCGVEYVHLIKEHSWGQRVVRIYDPDRHIIEIGENMKVVCKRFLDSGMTPEQVAQRMDVPMKFVNACMR